MKKASARRIALTLGLIALSYVLAVAGRWVLDMSIQSAPSWASILERIGGWLIGVVIVLVVVLPMFRLWGLIKPKAADAQAGER